MGFLGLKNCFQYCKQRRRLAADGGKPCFKWPLRFCNLGLEYCFRITSEHWNVTSNFTSKFEALLPFIACNHLLLACNAEAIFLGRQEGNASTVPCDIARRTTCNLTI